MIIPELFLFFVAESDSKEINLFQAINNAMDIALETDDSASECDFSRCEFYQSIFSC